MSSFYIRYIIVSYHYLHRKLFFLKGISEKKKIFQIKTGRTTALAKKEV